MNFLQRLAARIFFGTHSVFEGANQSPRRSNVPGSGPRDTTLDLTPGVRSELVRRSRYLVKNSGFLQEIISSMALYAIGDGILPQPSGKDAQWNQQALAYFNRWAQRAEITGRFDLIVQLTLSEEEGLSLLDFFKYELVKVAEVLEVESFVVYQSHSLWVPYDV